MVVGEEAVNGDAMLALSGIGVGRSAGFSVK